MFRRLKERVEHAQKTKRQMDWGEGDGEKGGARKLRSAPDRKGLRETLLGMWGRDR